MGCNMSATEQKQDTLYDQLIKPFVDLINSPRSLIGINLPYFIEGFVYFGMLTYLAMFFNDYVGLPDVEAG